MIRGQLFLMFRYGTSYSSKITLASLRIVIHTFHTVLWGSITGSLMSFNVCFQSARPHLYCILGSCRASYGAKGEIRSNGLRRGWEKLNGTEKLFESCVLCAFLNGSSGPEDERFQRGFELWFVPPVPSLSWGFMDETDRNCSGHCSDDGI